MTLSKTIKSYLFPSILIASIVLGGLTGYLVGLPILKLKPLGDIFLNLIFTMIIPLIFFSITSAATRAASLEKLSNIMFNMIIVFIFTGLIAAIFMLFAVIVFPPTASSSASLLLSTKVITTASYDQFANILTVSDFAKLLYHENMLPLIIFSILVGIAASKSGEKAKLFINFLQAGEDIFMRVFSLIMYYAPIGFFAYFAVLAAELGPKLMESYIHIAIIYTGAALVYFFVAFTFYAYLAGKIQGVKLFWSNIFLPVVTSIATCSSAASIPANLSAAKAMHVPPEIYETTIPLGAIIHKDGSVMGGVLKIAFLFGLFHLNFAGVTVLFTALGVSLLVGTVMGAIPSGGMLGELLILNFYGFPPSALIMIAAISIIIDPLATILNVTGNCASSMLITRLVDGK